MPAIKVPMRDRLRSLTAFGVQRGYPTLPCKDFQSGRSHYGASPSPLDNPERAHRPRTTPALGRTEHLKFDRVVIDTDAGAHRRRQRDLADVDTFR
jgi:hypothetical protein